MLEGEGECPERGPGSSYRAVGGRRLQRRVGEGLMGDVACENGRGMWHARMAVTDGQDFRDRDILPAMGTTGAKAQSRKPL